MIIRALQPEEYAKLQDHPGLNGHPLPDPATSTILIAERGEEILAFWTLVQIVHAEPIWIAPAHRNRLVLKRLWSALRALLATCRIPAVYCFADRPEVAGYLTRLGLQELPYRTFRYDTPCPFPSLQPPSPPAAASAPVG